MEDKSDNLSARYSVRHMPSWLGKGDNRGRKDKDQQPYRVPGDRSTLYDGHWLDPKIFQESSSGTCRYSDQRDPKFRLQQSAAINIRGTLSITLPNFSSMVSRLSMHLTPQAVLSLSRLKNIHADSTSY
ncbi:hypothetical protein NDA18_000493 [Ustilago nuda]|nr:hypothetical protein NDA18_000493 [Ustilago nuda]